MRRSLIAMVAATSAVLWAAVAVVPASAGHGRVVVSSQPHTAEYWVCVVDQYQQGVPLGQALAGCGVSTVGPDGTPVGTGTADPFGGYLGRGDSPTSSDITVACGTGDSRVASGDGGTPATKPEIDAMMMKAWKDYTAALNEGRMQDALAAKAEYDQLKAAKGYAPHGRVGPLGAERCAALQEAIRQLDRQIQNCENDGWQSSYECSSLAAVLFGCVDPAVALTTGDYSCGGLPTQEELDAAAKASYALCAQLVRGGPDTDPCQRVAADPAVLRAVLYEQDKCRNPYARWDSCFDTVDLDAGLASVLDSITTSFHELLVQLCGLVGGVACLGPPQGDEPPFPGPGPKRDW